MSVVPGSKRSERVMVLEEGGQPLTPWSSKLSWFISVHLTSIPESQTTSYTADGEKLRHERAVDGSTDLQTLCNVFSYP